MATLIDLPFRFSTTTDLDTRSDPALEEDSKISSYLTRSFL